MKRKILSILVTAGLPLTTFAAISNFSGLVTQITNYVRLLVPLIIAFTILVFLWGIFKLVFVSRGNDKELEEAKKFMLWGIISLFVMVSVWGLVRILTKSFFNDDVIIPQLKTTMLSKETV